MAVVTIIISLIGYGIAKSYRCYVMNQRAGLLEPPPHLCKLNCNPLSYILYPSKLTILGNDEEPSNIEDEKEIKRTPRYSKSQARLRYKKGKL